MSTVNQREFHVAIEKGEDGYYIATVIELPGCHTQAKTLEELESRTREAIEVYLEVEGESLSVPEFVELKKVRV
ncbi:MAG: type II toxin-antitoxin system HicB family antitoxin [Candidatus Bathyarchaeia archaeon]